MADGNGKGYSRGDAAARGNKDTEFARQEQAIGAMLLTHRTYDEMAQQLGVSQGTITNIIKHVRANWRKRCADDYEALLAEEMAKLDALERTVFVQALRSEKNLFAVDRALAIMDRRARMMGLDAPSKVEVHMRVEMVVRAFEDTIAELGLDEAEVRPVMARRLRELDVIAEGRNGNGR